MTIYLNVEQQAIQFMKKLFLITLALAALSSLNSFAQVKGQDMETYRRSSLTMVMLEDPNLSPDVAELVKESFITNPVPAKFNDHRIDGYKSFEPYGMKVSKEDREAYNKMAGTKKGTKDSGDGSKAGLAKSIMGAVIEIGPTDYRWRNPVIDTTKRNAPFYAYKFVTENDLARKMVKKWFFDENGNPSIKLLIERSFENATEAQKQEARENTGGSYNQSIDYLMNHGGWDLVSNTFVTISRFRYLNADDMYFEIMNGAAIGAQFMPRPAADAAMDLAETAATSAMMSIGRGYAIYTTTYLYRLVWNEEVKAAVMRGAFDEYPFQLEYVGEENAAATIAVGKRSMEEAVNFATSRSIDKVISKLEKKYEVFRTKTPLLSIDPIHAGIGTKECVQKGDRYEVLSVSMGKNGESVYKTVATIKVETVGNNMGEDCDDVTASSDTFTTFSGKLNPKIAHPGTLIRQAGK